MSVQSDIESKLIDQLSVDYCEVVNESHMHSVPPNSETHFRVVIVSPQFEGKRDVARHQKVYGVLAEEIAGPVHALALHTYTAQEWQLRKEQAPGSPDCMGKNKSGQG